MPRVGKPTRKNKLRTGVAGSDALGCVAPAGPRSPGNLDPAKRPLRVRIVHLTALAFDATERPSQYHPAVARLALLAPLLLLVACATAKPPARPPEVDVAQRIARIEQGLLPAVQVAGEDVRHALVQRMRERKIPAISIAVFVDYRVQWARAYGVARLRRTEPSPAASPR